MRSLSKAVNGPAPLLSRRFRRQSDGPYEDPVSHPLRLPSAAMGPRRNRTARRGRIVPGSAMREGATGTRGGAPSPLACFRTLVLRVPVCVALKLLRILGPGQCFPEVPVSCSSSLNPDYSQTSSAPAASRPESTSLATALAPQCSYGYTFEARLPPPRSSGRYCAGRTTRTTDIRTGIS